MKIITIVEKTQSTDVHGYNLIIKIRCEFCNHIQNEWVGFGDDEDNNDIREKIARTKCENCGKTSPENYKPLETKIINFNKYNN